MNKFYILENLEVKIELEPVMRLIDCNSDSPVYDEMVDEFNSIYDEVMSLAEPVGILGFGTITEAAASQRYPTGTKVIYAAISVGDKISQRSTRAFSEGDYVIGMICDSMADCALFSLEEALENKLKSVCEEHNVGIAARLEAPHDIPMEVQKDAWSQLKLQERFGIGISSGYMLDPVKSSCQVYVITDNTECFKTQHNCRKCSNVGCKLRNIPPTEIKLLKNNKTILLELKENESLMDGLIREGHYISAICGGKGRCGKCKVRLLDGYAPVSGEDKSFFSQKELDEGWRLSCLLYPEEDLTVSLSSDDESDFEVISDYEYSVSDSQKCDDCGYDIAIDLGTTTIAAQLISKASGEICHTVTMINRQRQYGADVVSRIQASVDGKSKALQDCIRNDLKSAVVRLCSEYGIDTSQISRIAISGNTTMGHLLMGYDCKTLGSYPFTPVNVGFISGTVKEIIGLESDSEVVILPGISAYVGGDIVSGLYECGFDKTDDICLLVDLGTNGEMALGNREKILVTSTAAGPAFEGGNISCGTGSVEGAICSVRLDGSNILIQTIKDMPPTGICGTGVIEIVAGLLKEGLMDETGLLDEKYFNNGFPVTNGIVFTQKDIRELQLAKAAIRAGIETLISRYGITKEQISTVYIAGGFGYRLDIEKAIEIGMLPDEFKTRTKAIGNSSLAGAVRYLRDTDNTLQKIVEISEEISLSTDSDFNNAYMEAMLFE